MADFVQNTLRRFASLQIKFLPFFILVLVTFTIFTAAGIPKITLQSDLEEMNPDDVNAKEQLYEQLRHKPTWEKTKNACDLWTAAFFLPLVSGNVFNLEGVPTTQTVRQCLATNTANPITIKPRQICKARFHWCWTIHNPAAARRASTETISAPHRMI